MSKPWHIWLAFSLCLVAVFAAMLWLSFQTVRLDALRETDRTETEIARREAELQERISSALYRMDLKLLPLVAGEAARPYYFYQPFFEVTNPRTVGGLQSDAPSGLFPQPIPIEPQPPGVSGDRRSQAFRKPVQNHPRRCYFNSRNL